MAGVLDYILGDIRYQVIAPVVVVQLLNGSEAYVYRTGIIPAEASDRSLRHLLDKGMIRQFGGDQ